MDIIYRRFIPIGTKEDLDKLHSLVKEKNLSRRDLTLILKSIKLNPDVFEDMQKLCLDNDAIDDDADAILAIYAEHKKKNAATAIAVNVQGANIGMIGSSINQSTVNSAVVKRQELTEALINNFNKSSYR